MFVLKTLIYASIPVVSRIYELRSYVLGVNIYSGTMKLQVRLRLAGKQRNYILYTAWISRTLYKFSYDMRPDVLNEWTILLRHEHTMIRVNIYCEYFCIMTFQKTFEFVHLKKSLQKTYSIRPIRLLCITTQQSPHRCSAQVPRFVKLLIIGVFAWHIK